MLPRTIGNRDTLLATDPFLRHLEHCVELPASFVNHQVMIPLFCFVITGCEAYEVMVERAECIVWGDQIGDVLSDRDTDGIISNVSDEESIH